MMAVRRAAQLPKECIQPRGVVTVTQLVWPVFAQADARFDVRQPVDRRAELADQGGRVDRPVPSDRQGPVAMRHYARAAEGLFSCGTRWSIVRCAEAVFSL
jgi:hypothetical protein